jgi:hypothetical protein
MPEVADAKVWCRCGHRRELHDYAIDMRESIDQPNLLLQCLVIYKDDPANKCGCQGYFPDPLLNELGGP